MIVYHFIRLYSGNVCKIWNIETNDCVKTLTFTDPEKARFKIWTYKVVQKSKLLALCDDDLFRIFDLASGTFTRSFRAFVDLNEHYSNNQVKVISHSHAAMDIKQQINIYNIVEGHLEKVFDLTDASNIPVKILAILEKSNILCGYYHAAREMKLVDFASGSVIQTFSGHMEAIKSAHVLSNGCFVSSSFNQIKVWNARTGECLKSLLNDEFINSKCLILTESQILVSLSPHYSLSMWNANEDFKWLGEFRFADFGPTCCVKSLSGQKIVSYWNDRRIQIWDISVGKRLRNLDLAEEGFNYKLELCAHF